jgi:hypothetical protein
MINTQKNLNKKHISRVVPNKFDNNYDLKTSFSLHISKNKFVLSLYNRKKKVIYYIQRVLFYNIRETPQLL